MNVQVPGKFFTFVREKTGEKDKGILPEKPGLSNGFASWQSTRNHVGRGGIWASRKFLAMNRQDIRDGIGSNGLLGRMKMVLRQSRNNANQRGYKAASSTPEKLVELWKSQNNKCAICQEHLSLTASVLEHCHEKGTVRGFTHKSCNFMEGVLRKMPKRGRKRLYEWMESVFGGPVEDSIGL